ncbi:hypothetical protein FSP39_007475 [Pinctada imbricata]|uniref:Uncharacterized protein n=1 Tax=Pinctada imbricata TaxID=66713 RepID=A0AA88XHE9_PINIB|nr:hypothetical protein FSP39_007475 [Pinctada imbricata]
MESLGLILMIPFSVCFLLLFIVCCFADELKKMCRMPSQLPLHYVPEERIRRQRMRRERRRSNRGQNTSGDDIESLMTSRSRNSSGSSTDTSVTVEHDRFPIIAVLTSERLPNGRVIESHVDAQSLLSVSQTILNHSVDISQSQFESGQEKVS